jgi:ribosomal protein S18 acetylase RimI-like enzyme
MRHWFPYRGNIFLGDSMIKEFHIEDAAALADMFNESDEGWPGGFTHGVTFTPDVIVDMIKKRKALSELVAWHENKIVGLVEMIEHWQGKNTAYIEFLNVIPQYHGKGYGRDLLRACVEKAAELHYVRVDLHTWSGNMKAVPLYKKTGFFWVPKTDVHMKNFIPFILTLEAAQPYFSHHDWYATFKRELTVEEDDFDGVFPYRWEEDGKILSVTIDAESGGMSALETNDFSISQSVENAFAGVTAQVTWIVKNKKKEPLSVALIARGTPHVTIEKQETITVENECTLTTEAFISADIEIPKEEEPPHLLNTDVVINGTPLTLTAGLRVKHALEVSTHPEYLFLPPGEREILVVLKNNTKTTANGTIICQNTGESHSFRIESKHREAVPFTIEVMEDHDLSFIIEDSPCIHTVPVRVGERGASFMMKDREIVMENDHCRVIVTLRGGSVAIYDKHTKKMWIREIQPRLGPPFWPSDFIKTLFTSHTAQSGTTSLAEITGKSKTHRCTFTQKIEMDASPIITISHSMIPERPIQLLLHVHGLLSGGKLTIPFKDGLVSEPTLGEEFPLGHGDLPHDPQAFNEQWIAFERDGSVFGMVWETCSRIELEDYHPFKLTQDAQTLRPIYLYMGRGAWEEVRAVWSRIHRKEIMKKEEPVRIWNITPTIFLTVDDALSRELTIFNRRKKPLTGTINNSPFTALQNDPFIYSLAVDDVPLGMSTTPVNVETDLFSTTIPLTIARVGTQGEVTIEEEEVITVHNGLYTFTVAPQFYGSVIFFGKEHGANHLLTSFPETTQFSWLKPWWGGIFPSVFLKDNQFPGRMYKETFSHEVTERTIDDIPWSGVTVTSQLQEIKGLQLETSYLSTANSNMLVIDTALKNHSTAPFTLNMGVFFYLQPDGSYEDAILYYDLNDLCERKRTEFGAWTQCHRWAAVKGEKTYLTVISDNMEIEDLGKEGAHLFSYQRITLASLAEFSYRSYCIATNTLEQSRAYHKLREVSWT